MLKHLYGAATLVACKMSIYSLSPTKNKYFKFFKMTVVRIKENSWLAKLAAKQLKTRKVAMVLGKTIHLYEASREEFLDNKKWVRHELAHVKQFNQLGFVRFIALYLLETFNKGYEHNSFEVEARQMEKDSSVTKGIQFN
jgi:hypothetical protein